GASAHLPLRQADRLLDHRERDSEFRRLHLGLRRFRPSLGPTRQARPGFRVAGLRAEDAALPHPSGKRLPDAGGLLTDQVSADPTPVSAFKLFAVGVTP